MTGLARLFPLIMKRLPFFRSAEEGAAGVIHAATSPELAGVTGAYLARTTRTRSKPITYDRDIALRHWAISERLAGLHREERQAAVDAAPPRPNVRASPGVTKGAAARTSEKPLTLTPDLNHRSAKRILP
jgi:hypothetical protein